MSPSPMSRTVKLNITSRARGNSCGFLQITRYGAGQKAMSLLRIRYVRERTASRYCMRRRTLQAWKNRERRYYSTILKESISNIFLKTRQRKKAVGKNNGVKMSLYLQKSGFILLTGLRTFLLSFPFGCRGPLRTWRKQVCMKMRENKTFI